MKLFEMILDEEAIANGVDAISLVQQPAIEANFVALSKLEPVGLKFATVNDEKRIIMGAVLIPNKPILRLDEQGEPFHIFFSEETINKASQLFLKRGYQNSATLEHSVKLQGVTVVESWMVESKEMDKSKLHNLEVEDGAWVVSMHIENSDVWSEYVKSGQVKGFSIEGWFNQTKVENKKQRLTAKIRKTI